MFTLGLILPLADTRLAEASGADSKASPFVLAIEKQASTRTMQAMAQRGMAHKLLPYVAKTARSLRCVDIQLAFGLLWYIGAAPKGIPVVTWLLALSGLSYFFVWGFAA
ncbi:hypothetical protein DL768_003999 [Monosporascus sp. mg162]|nr:hypothetical protein DL768_003999 [Monosporascus sp. mg162]